jgi:hypothetical protein
MGRKGPSHLCPEAVNPLFGGQRPWGLEIPPFDGSVTRR